MDEDKRKIIFKTTEGDVYVQLHTQSCCEVVRVEDICGDLEDLVGKPILQATETSNSPKEGDEGYCEYGSSTWTFYNISTIKGSVTIRWLGESNGYYSESVEFYKDVVAANSDKVSNLELPDGYESDSHSLTNCFGEKVAWREFGQLEISDELQSVDEHAIAIWILNNPR